MASIPDSYHTLLNLLRSYYNHLLTKLSTIPIILTLTLPTLIILTTLYILSNNAPPSSPKGHHKFGLLPKSNLYGGISPPSSASNKDWQIKSLHIYPIKSCRGIEMDKASVIATGLNYDRLFSFARLRSSRDWMGKEKGEEGKWEVVTQRELPMLARVEVEVWMPDGYEKMPDGGGGGILIVKFPYQQTGFKGLITLLISAITNKTPEKSFTIPLSPSPTQIRKAGYTHSPLKIWKDTIPALNISKEIPGKELGDFLGTKGNEKLGLFRVDDKKVLREVYRNAPRKEEMGWQAVVGFQDAYPIHLIGLASIRDLESRIVDKERGRDWTLGVTGPQPYEEDTWRRIKLGSHSFDVSCRTARCKMPNVDQETGEKHASEPDRTLRRYRNVDEGAGKGIGCLGMQVVPLKEEGMELSVGDKVSVVERGEHFYLKMF